MKKSTRNEIGSLILLAVIATVLVWLIAVAIKWNSEVKPSQINPQVYYYYPAVDSIEGNKHDYYEHLYKMK